MLHLSRAWWQVPGGAPAAAPRAPLGYQRPGPIPPGLQSLPSRVSTPVNCSSRGYSRLGTQRLPDLYNTARQKVGVLASSPTARFLPQFPPSLPKATPSSELLRFQNLESIFTLLFSSAPTPNPSATPTGSLFQVSPNSEASLLSSQPWVSSWFPSKAPLSTRVCG